MIVLSRLYVVFCHGRGGVFILEWSRLFSHSKSELDIYLCSQLFLSLSGYLFRRGRIGKGDE